MNIYLDIDGVLITKNHEPVEGVEGFLEYVTGNHVCHWLTTHCKGRENNRALEVLGEVYGESLLRYARKIQPTTWQTFKTEAIDFSQDFRWFDDYVMSYEEVILKNERAFEKLILIDLEKNPNFLREVRI